MASHRLQAGQKPHKPSHFMLWCFLTVLAEGKPSGIQDTRQFVSMGANLPGLGEHSDWVLRGEMGKKWEMIAQQQLAQRSNSCQPF